MAMQRPLPFGSMTVLENVVLGAMFGGVLEYLAISTGYRNLLFLVAALYGLAFALGPRPTGGEVAPEPAEREPVPA